MKITDKKEILTMNIQKALELVKQAKTDNSKLIELEQYLTYALTEQMAKNKGGNAEKTRLTTAKKYIDTCIKNLPFQQSAHGTWVENNIQYLTNTYSLFKLFNPIEGLKTIPDEIKKFPAESIFPSKSYEYDKIELPLITDLKTQLKIAQTDIKGTKTDITIIPGGHTFINKIMFNTRYLIECLEILGGNIEGYVQRDNINSLIWLKSENGECILLPILQKKTEEKSA